MTGRDRGARGGGWALATLCCVAVLAAVFAGALDPARQFGYRDTGRLHHPVKRWISAELARGHLPEWNPYSGLGAPVVASAADAPQHPFNALFLALPFEAALKGWVLLSYLAAALGGFAWGRALGGGVPAALVAGLGFALSGFLLSASDNLTFLTTLAAVPWIFATATSWIERGGKGRLALTAIAGGLCAAGGDPQAWAIALAALPFYAASLSGRGPGLGRAVGRGVAAAAAAAIASAPFILPVLAWLPASSRAARLDPAALTRWDLHPLRLLELAVPYLVRPLSPAPSSEVFRVYAGDALSPLPWAVSVYCGASVLALAALGAARARRAPALLAGAAVLTWMALGHHAGWGALAAHLPLVGALRYWEKVAGWPALLAAPAAALGLEALAAGRAPRAFDVSAAALGALAAATGVAARLARAPLASALTRGPGTEVAAGTLAHNVSEGLVTTGLALLAVGALAFARRRGALRPGVTAWAGVAIVVADLATAGASAFVLLRTDALDPRAPLAAATSAPALERVVTPFELTAARFPERPPFESVWIWGSRTLAPPWNVPRRVGNLEPYAPMPPLRLSEILSAARLPAERVALAGLWGVAGVVVPRAPGLAAEVGVAPPFSTRAADPELPAYVVALPHRARAYVASRVEGRDAGGARAFALDPASGRGDLTVVEGPVRARAAHGSARVERDDGERVVVRAEADGEALVVLSDAFAPGWTATVDGAPAAILPANYLVRGVWIGPGGHEVEFRYRTPLWRAGWAWAGALAAAFVVAAAVDRRRAPACGGT